MIGASKVTPKDLFTKLPCATTNIVAQGLSDMWQAPGEANLTPQCPNELSLTQDWFAIERPEALVSNPSLP
jgi:hypothetical protein